MTHIRYEWKEPSLSIMVDEEEVAIVTVARTPNNSSFAVVINNRLVACSNQLGGTQADNRIMIAGLHEDLFLEDEAIKEASINKIIDAIHTEDPQQETANATQRN
jgi:hypothetical protein